MTKPTFAEEVQLYDVFSRVAATVVGESSMKIMAMAIDELSKGVGQSGEEPVGTFKTASQTGLLSASDTAVLTNYSNEDIVKSWKKMLKKVEFSIDFVSELNRSPNTGGFFVKSGDKIDVINQQGIKPAFIDIDVDVDIDIDIDISIGWSN
jgi:hypothetical protein